MLQNIILSLILFLIGITGISGQNLVPNHSFEDNGILHPNSPTDQSQLEHTQHWKNFETSDLLSDEAGKYNSLFSNIPNHNGTSGTTMPAHTGHKFFGFGPCEGGQVKLINNVERMQWVVLSFWFSPRGKTDTEINAYLLKNQASGNALNDCTNPNITYEVVYTVQVNADGSDAIHTPGNWYFYQSLPQLVTEEEYEWLAIKGRNVSGNLSSSEYVNVDDVELIAYDFCDNICVTTGNVTLNAPPGGIQNAMIGNSPQNFFATFLNAKDVHFQVIDPDLSAGCVIYDWYSYDVNGLIDPGFTDFAVVWNGNTNVSSNCHPGLSDVIFPDVYVIRLDATSCSGTNFHFEGTLTVLDINGQSAIPYPETQNKNFTLDCCPTDAYYQNQTFNTYFREDVDNNIYAGANVTIGPTGNVVVQPGGDVRFFAGNQIILDPGFIVLPGGNYVGTIGPCAANPRAMESDSTSEIIRAMRGARGNMPYSFILDEVKIVPNPSAGTFVVELSNFNLSAIESVSVSDITGTTITTIKKERFENAIDIDLSSKDSGVYLLRIQLKDGKQYIRKMIKS